MEESVYERLNFWGEANWAFKHNPIFGVGLDFITEFIGGDRAVHNAFVMCYAELGVFGYFFWFTLILVAVIGLSQTKKYVAGDDRSDAKYLHRLSCWGLASFFGFLASAFFLSRAFVFPLFFLISLFGAVPYVARQISEDAKEMYIPGGRDCVILGVPMSLASIVYVYVSILLMNAAR